MYLHANAMPQTLQQKIDFLSQASNYPDKTTSVEVIETHMSWVFLTDEFAYKLKKPVTYDYLDFSTLDARRYFCQEELRLNRRMAANVYLNVLSLTKNNDEALAFEGGGTVVEWLIRMRRLPSELVLDQCIRKRLIPERPFNRLAERLALFYLTSRPEPISAKEYREQYVHRIVDVIGALAPKGYLMPRDVIKGLFRKMNVFVTQRGEMLEERPRAGKIVEGHGDLRAEHVYLEDEPVIMDCIEFSKELRTVDAVADMAFLALDCERLGAGFDGERLMKRFFAITADYPPPMLIHFYQTYHACSRARLALWHLKEPQYSADPKWRLQALEWLKLAERHAHYLS